MNMTNPPAPVVTTGALLTAGTLGAIAAGVWLVATYCKTIAEQTGEIVRCQQEIRAHWRVYNDRNGIPIQEVRDRADMCS